MLEWGEQYKLGIRAIDCEHLMLFSLLNQLDVNIRTHSGDDCAPDILDALTLYVKMHFKNEEEMLRKSSYPSMDLDRHMHEHEDFTGRLDQFRKECRAEPDEAPQRILRFMLEWLLNHILVIDRTYVPYLRAASVLAGEE